MSVKLHANGDIVQTANPLPVTTVGGAGASFVDRSGTITAGGTSQQVAAANASRRYLVFQNHSDTDMWLNFGVAAVASQPSVKLSANGGAYEPLVAPLGTINVIGATTGKAFTCKEA